MARVPSIEGLLDMPAWHTPNLRPGCDEIMSPAPPPPPNIWPEGLETSVPDFLAAASKRPPFRGGHVLRLLFMVTQAVVAFFRIPLSSGFISE